MTDEAEFFSRQRRLRELDLDRLRAASALVVGLGNVGGPAALELARAGIGRIALIDHDQVMAANFSRGIFRDSDLGTSKVIAAASAIGSSVAKVAVDAFVADVRVEIPELLISSYDAVVIATDSWSSRWFVNRWAHALPGRVKIIVSGGLRGLSWDLISSVPGGACGQCPHGNEVSATDEGGGCGIIGDDGFERVDPSVSFTGSAVAAHMAMEVCATLGGSGPRYAGRMLSFDYEDGAHRVLSILPAPSCDGHRRLAEGSDYIVLADEGVTLGELERRVAATVGVDPGDVSLAVEHEVLRSRACRACGARNEIMLPLLIASAQASALCAGCGSRTFDFDLRTTLEGAERTLEQLGVPKGKAIIAFARGVRLYVIRRSGT
jgi:molybdopterin/thiamine biosynthesis adenylyltransferase